MPFSLNEIKSFQSIDLDNFAIRGAKTGINNAKSTGPLYDDGTFFPYKTTVYGDTSVSNNDATVKVLSFDSPYSPMNAFSLVAGDTMIVRSDTTLIVSRIIDSGTVAVNSAPGFSGLCDSTFKLKDRDYLIEPDVDNNTTTTGFAQFTNDSTRVVGLGTNWLTDLTSGDAIQLNSYQKYFTISQVYNDETCGLTTKFDTDSVGYNPYTAKKWRLNRLKYQYVKQDFTYDNHVGRWVYDATTGSDRTAFSVFSDFTDGVQIKFSPTLDPTNYPDVMDSNVVKDKVFTRSTSNPSFQYPLPAVPKPEESLNLFINGSLKDRFPDGSKFYVVNYSQSPNYEFPPAESERTVANVMFLKGISKIALNPADTASGIIQFTDESGNALPGIMPGSETIVFNDTTQTPNSSYVIDVNAGLAYSSEFNTAEPVVKYVMYQQNGLYDYGLYIYKNGTSQTFTIPGQSTDDIQFDTESGIIKPMEKDYPGPGEQYDIFYYTESDYISNEPHIISGTTDWIRVNSYPIKFQSAIVSKNGEFLDENVNYRVSYLTGRIVFFTPLVSGDTVVVNYSPMQLHRNGITYENGTIYCKSYGIQTTVASTYPIAFVFPNPNLIGGEGAVGTGVEVQDIYNATKAKFYNLDNVSIIGSNVQVISDSTNTAVGTESSDDIYMTYKFPSESTEYSPVQTINFTVSQGSNFMALVNQDSTGLFPAGSFVRLTNVDTGGDFYFKDASSVYDGEDTVVYFTGTASSDIINPTVFVSDFDNVTFNAVTPPSGIVNGSKDIKFLGTNIASTFRTGQLMNLGDDYYSVQDSKYDSSSNNTTVSLGVQTITDYTSTYDLSNVTTSDIPIHFAGETVLSTRESIIIDPLAPVMTISYPGYAKITKDASAFTIDTETSHFTYLDVSYPTINQLYVSLTGDTPTLSVTVNAFSWKTSKIEPFTDVPINKDTTAIIRSNPALYYNAVDSTNYQIVGGVLVVNNPLVPGDRYSMDYLGLKPLNDTTVTFSGSYFTTLPASSTVSASMRYDNIDQFYIQSMSERTFLETVIEPARQEAANQQNGNAGQGGDLPGDENSGNSAGGLTNNEYNRVDSVIEEKIFSTIFNFFNDRLQSYSTEMLAMKGWNLCNNDGLLSEDDASGGALSINRMFPWADYTNMEPFKIACLTGQAIPYAVPGPKKPRERKARKRRRVWFHTIPAYRPPPACRAIFIPGLTDVTCTTAISGFPSYWTYQLRAGDFIKPFDSTKNYEITAIVNDSSMSITPAYGGASTLISQFIMTSKYPLFDDDGYVGPKTSSDLIDDFGLVNGDVFDATVDGLAQSYTFIDPISSDGLPLAYYSVFDVSMLLSFKLDIKVTPQWVFDSESAYGYENGMILKADGTRNKIILGKGSAVIKLGFEPDSTYIGNFDNTDNNPEFIYLRQELADCSSQRIIAGSSLVSPNLKIRTNDSDATAMRNLCIDEVKQILAEMEHLNVEIAATSQLILEPSMAGYSNAVKADATHRKFMADSSVALIYDSSIINNWMGFGTAQKWLNDWSPYSDFTNITGQTSLVVTVDPSYDRRILGTGAIDGNVYYPIVQYLDTNFPDGAWSDDAGPLGALSGANDATFTFNSIPMFSLNYTPAVDYTIAINPFVGANVSWSASSTFIPFTLNPTVGDLKAALRAIPGIMAYNSGQEDATICSNLAFVGATPFTSINLLDTGSNILLTVANIGAYNFEYYVDTTGLGIRWNTTQQYEQYYPYSSFSTVLDYKTVIKNGDGLSLIPIPGLDATGDIVNDSSSPIGFVLTPITAIPPDATVYSGMRDGYVYYWTVDDKNLIDKSSFDTSRIDILNNRLAFLDLREAQIRSDVTSEEYLRSNQGCLGNLYSWADNRFNRSAGSSAKVSQVNKQQDTNSSSKEVNLRFISGTSQSGQTCNG